MNDLPPPLSSPEASMRGPWIAWITGCTLTPALPFLLTLTPVQPFLLNGIKDPVYDGAGLIILAFLCAILCTIGSSIWLAVRMADKMKKGSGYAVLMAIVFIIASVIIGTASYFASCIGLGAALNLR